MDCSATVYLYSRRTTMNRTYGYCRISTAKQNISRQIRNITRSYPDARIIEETYTGTTTDRPAFDRNRR